ncbi:MAG: hypothetical protein ACREFU_20295 [Acetobacteraceae bacterium]
MPSGQGLGYIGYGADPEQFIWFLNWLPFAWHHHLDLFWTRFVAAPTGMSLAWHTSIPALGLVVAPFTLKYGALAAYNGLMRIAPGLAGVGMFWAARELTGRTLPAFVAGLVFGFSTYEIGQSLGHLNLTFTLAAPLLVWAGLRAIRRDWPPALLALVTGVLFAFQFGVSQEIAASFFMLAALAACWIWVRDPGFRPVLCRLAPGVLGGLAVAFLLAFPLLFAMLSGGARSGTSIAAPAEFSTDLLNFVVPTAVTLPFGHLAAPLAHRFRGNFSEEAGYLGLPLILLLAWIGKRHRERIIRLPLELAVLAAILSIGPVLHVAGHALLPAPWALISWLPVLDDMLPARFMLYAWLALALGLAAWLARPHPRRIVAGRLVAVAGALAFCMPNAAQVGHWTRLHIPSIFITHGSDAIPANASVFILPFSGDHIGAQYASGLRFRLVAQGYLGGGIVRPFSQWPLITPLFNNRFDSVDRREFAAFLASYDVQEVLVERDVLSHPGRAQALVAGAGWRLAFRHGSVTAYVPPAQSPPPAVLARERAAYFKAKQRDTLVRRERMNVCAIRRLEAAIGLHPAFVWSVYRRYFDLPLPIRSITCRKENGAPFAHS